MFHWLFISILVNTVSVSILFKHTYCISKKINISFIIHFSLGKYSFSLRSYWMHFVFYYHFFNYHHRLVALCTKIFSETYLIKFTCGYRFIDLKLIFITYFQILISDFVIFFLFVSAFFVSVGKNKNVWYLRLKNNFQLWDSMSILAIKNKSWIENIIQSIKNARI